IIGNPSLNHRYRKGFYSLFKTLQQNHRNQASIVFDVAKQMVQMSRPLEKRSKIMGATKRIVNYSNAGFYQVLSAETGTKHGLNVSGLVFDEIHAQPNRHLYDVLTKGSGDAREQPLFFIITTAGTDRNSICYELHTKALDILNGRKKDTSFYPVVYGLSDEDDWNDEANWLKANPSLGHTIGIDRVREAYQQALDNPAEENVFKQLRLNMWTSSSVAWIPEHVYAKGNDPIQYESLKGRSCYAGLDLSSTSDITAFVLVFPPRFEEENYIVLPFFWLPEDTLELRCRRDHVLYDVWERQGYIKTTEGNVVHYGFIEKFIEDLSEIYHIKEIAYDRWNATQMVQNLEGMGLTMVPFGQGYKDMSPPSKELYKLMMEGKIQHGGHPVLKWMGQNVVMRQDPAGNIKPDKEKSVEKIDGIVALIMGLDRCIRHQTEEGSVYDERGILSF
ncbi:terminase large subunit, partial [Streptococcus suis]|uniref:terminase large subunit n=1 Tax=Streptococcus suis TaxID=1307 RepID=UPI0038B940BC